MKRNLMMNMTMTALMIVSLTGSGALSSTVMTHHAPTASTALGSPIAVTASVTSESEEGNRSSEEDEESAAS